MGKTTGFLEYSRAENPYRSAEERLRDFEELHAPQSVSVRREQASRCMNCGVPFCQSDYGCPLNNLIPEWNELLYRGFEKEALERLLETAPFPEFTGRVCPALCEKACNLANEGVTNRDNELYLIETGFEKGWIQARIPAKRSGRRVAVVGSGPSGLAAADILNRMGHEVSVIERADLPGGLLMYGIPNMKLPKRVILRRVELMEKEGVRFVLNTETDAEALRDFDAVLLCGGARRPRALNVGHIDAGGVCYAVEYLTEATRALLKGRASTLDARGKHVVVVGGGDTGNDCVGTALRQGCAGVTQLEMMPAPPPERAAGNPWPEWPRTLKTDYGQLEALAVQGRDPRIYETTVKEICTDAQNRITALTTVRLERGAQGRLVPAAGSENTLPCELLLIAAGFVGCEENTLNEFSLAADQRGRLLPADGSHYLGGKLFSAGDMRTGQSLVVRALADGRKAAQEIDAWMKGKSRI
ncbi:MAG: glutamate synthase subunit beta [Clostridia bacterium]|nr:glutamate synthase subunit beta [Clostridia bacterium]